MATVKQLYDLLERVRAGLLEMKREWQEWQM